MTDEPHLDLPQLDALRAGDPPTAAQRAHLAWCEACRSTLAELDELAAQLRATNASVAVPPERDAAILALARQAAARSARPVPRRAPTAARWAAAAMLVVAVGALVLNQRRASHPADHLAGTAAERAELSAAQADLDGDGRVTVLDAFALARAVTRGTPTLRDRDDVDAILAMAVSLDDFDLDDDAAVGVEQ
jgi:hypothetical protein